MYQVSVWVKSSAATNSGATVWLHDRQGNGAVATNFVPGTDWQQISVAFTAMVTRQLRIHRLQRLLASTQPESGTTSYQYDAAGNLTYRSDARGEETCYQYDALNRLQKKVYYSGSIPAAQAGNCAAIPASSLLPTPAVTYTYDNNPAVPYSIGRLTQVTNGLATTNYIAYDPLGRVTGSQESIGGQTYTFAYGYGLSGALTSETYPSGRVAQVSGGYASQQKTYFSDAEYEPDGQPAWFLYGNHLCRSFTYNSRLQIASSTDSVAQSPAQGTTCVNGADTHLGIAYNWTDLDAPGKNNGKLGADDVLSWRPGLSAVFGVQ
jgi:YD repeat-containing protein